VEIAIAVFKPGRAAAGQRPRPTAIAGSIGHWQMHSRQFKLARRASGSY
jgi:hypothetical protein